MEPKWMPCPVELIQDGDPGGYGFQPTTGPGHKLNASLAGDKLIMVEMDPGVAHRLLIKSRTMASDSSENSEETRSSVENFSSGSPVNLLVSIRLIRQFGRVGRFLESACSNS